MEKGDSHAPRHKLPMNEKNNNRYQADAPLIVYCPRCKAPFPADLKWVERAEAEDPDPQGYMRRKIARFTGKKVTIRSLGSDPRGRLEVDWELVDQ